MKFKVIIKGRKVHDVGYRVFLTNKAHSLGVKNFNTFNTFIDGTQSVIALIEADAEFVEIFKGFINTTAPNNAEVENVSIEEYINRIPPIETCMQVFQMEQWGKGIPILVKMLEKQDQIIDTIKTEGDKTRDVVSGYKSQDIEDLKQEISHIKNTMAKIANKVGVEV